MIKTFIKRDFNVRLINKEVQEVNGCEHSNNKMHINKIKYSVVINEYIYL